MLKILELRGKQAYMFVSILHLSTLQVVDLFYKSEGFFKLVDFYMLSRERSIRFN